MRKPRDMHSGFWDGFVEWCDWDTESKDRVNAKLGNATPGEMRRMAHWLLRAARYVDGQARLKRLQKRKAESHHDSIDPRTKEP